MNKQSPEYIRVREEIAEKLAQYDGWKLSLLSKVDQEFYKERATSLLEIRGIAILADSQVLPHGLTARLNLPDLEHYLYAESALSRANFKKVVE